MPEPGLDAASRARPLQVCESALIDDAATGGDEAHLSFANLDALDAKESDPGRHHARCLLPRVAGGLVERRTTELKAKTEERVDGSLRSDEQQRQRDGGHGIEKPAEQRRAADRIAREHEPQRQHAEDDGDDQAYGEERKRDPGAAQRLDEKEQPADRQHGEPSSKRITRGVRALRHAVRRGSSNASASSSYERRRVSAVSVI